MYFRKKISGGRAYLQIVGNCPASLSGLCGLEAGEQIGGASRQGLDEGPALFPSG